MITSLCNYTHYIIIPLYILSDYTQYNHTITYYINTITNIIPLVFSLSHPWVMQTMINTRVLGAALHLDSGDLLKPEIDNGTATMAMPTSQWFPTCYLPGGYTPSPGMVEKLVVISHPQVWLRIKNL